MKLISLLWPVEQSPTTLVRKRLQSSLQETQGTLEGLLSLLELLDVLPHQLDEDVYGSK